MGTRKKTCVHTYNTSMLRIDTACSPMKKPKKKAGIPGKSIIRVRCTGLGTTTTADHHHHQALRQAPLRSRPLYIPLLALRMIALSLPAARPLRSWSAVLTGPPRLVVLVVVLTCTHRHSSAVGVDKTCQKPLERNMTSSGGERKT